MVLVISRADRSVVAGSFPSAHGIIPAGHLSSKSTFLWIPKVRVRWKLVSTMQFSPKMTRKHAGVAFNRGFAAPRDWRMLYMLL